MGVHTCLLCGGCFLLVERRLHLLVFLGTRPATVVVHPVSFRPAGVRTAREGTGPEGIGLNGLTAWHHSWLDSSASLGGGGPLGPAATAGMGVVIGTND